MKNYINRISLLFMTAVLIATGCSNPLREKNRCEILCEQMHSECNVNCSTDSFDPACHERCDTFRSCRDTCDKPLFNEGGEEGNSGSENK